MHEAAEHFRTGRYEAGRIHLERSNWIPLRRSDRDWVAAATILAAGGEAGTELERVRRRGRRLFPPLQRDTVLETLVRQSRFDETLAWADAANGIGGETDREQLLQAAAYAGVGRIDDAEHYIGLVRRTDQYLSGLEAVRRAIVDHRRGLIPVVLDARGAVLMMWRVSDGSLMVTEPSATAVVEYVRRSQGISGPWPTLHLTIDVERQRAIAPIASSAPATIAVLSTGTRTLLALAGPPGVDVSSPVPLGDLARIAIPAPSPGVYPVTCEGLLRVDGDVAQDSGRHGLVPDHESAIAWGCAVAAGRAALASGPEPVSQAAARAGFQVTAFREIDLARLATDSGSARATPIDLVAFTAAVATDGVRATPRVVERRASILGEPLDGQSTAAGPVTDSAATASLAEAMRRSVLEARGEAHGLAALDYDVAALFGNHRGTDGRYSARMIAFAPVREPQYAIAVVMDGGGPARGLGSRVVADVLDAIEYRERIVPPSGSR